MCVCLTQHGGEEPSIRSLHNSSTKNSLTDGGRLAPLKTGMVRFDRSFFLRTTALVAVCHFLGPVTPDLENACPLALETLPWPHHQLPSTRALCSGNSF